MKESIKTILLFSIILIAGSCDRGLLKNGKNQSAEKTQENSEANLTDSISSSQKSYHLGDIEIELIQTRGSGRDFYCKSEILISRNDEILNTLSYSPDPVGGNYGISRPVEIANHLVFTKHGDYDGRTIIINESGEVFDLIGGQNFYDPEEQLLFTNYESDLFGFAVFDLKSDSLLLELENLEAEPISFHKAFGSRYFASFYQLSENSSQEEYLIWEIEINRQRLMELDLDTSQINKENSLKTWELGNVNCQCETI